MRVLSIHKFENNTINEDAGIATMDLIAVSDGAGGGGVFADRWSQYLVEHLPPKPIDNFSAFDEWIDNIWEPFYNYCEELAQKEGGMLLNKFYDEGSFATLLAVWKDGRWFSYGDSVAFCYDATSGILNHSFGRLVEFNEPPYLINCKDPSDEKGFRYGKFNIGMNSVVFATSDALAHYIMMMYKVAHQEVYLDELLEAIDAQTKDSNFIMTAMSLKKIDFEKDVINKLVHCRNKGNYKRHLESLIRKGLIAHDDYTLVTFS